MRIRCLLFLLLLLLLIGRSRLGSGLDSRLDSCGLGSRLDSTGRSTVCILI
jgi:hypothetical protein